MEYFVVVNYGKFYPINRNVNKLNPVKLTESFFYIRTINRVRIREIFFTLRWWNSWITEFNLDNFFSFRLDRTEEEPQQRRFPYYCLIKIKETTKIKPMHLGFKREKQRKQHILQKKCLYPENGVSRSVNKKKYTNKKSFVIEIAFPHLVKNYMKFLFVKFPKTNSNKLGHVPALHIGM